MLMSLFVQNFAIIDNIHLEFNNNMNVLTGETGAGKSLIIDAIGLLFGSRASSDLVRFQENKATIEGVFSEYSDKTKNILNSHGIEYYEDDFLILKREIYANGKSICKINDNVITLAVMNELAETLGDIHSQFDAHGLFSPKNYLQFIDDESTREHLHLYQTVHKEYSNAVHELDIIVEKNKDASQKLDFLKYQIKELEKANLRVEEEEELKSRLAYLSNFEEISKNMHEVVEIFQDKDVLDNMFQVLQYLQKIEKFDDSYKIYRTQVEDMYYTISDLAIDISSKLKKNDFDLSELDYINERLAVYAELKRKYKKNTSEIINEFHNMQQAIALYENYDDTITVYQKKIVKLQKELNEVGFLLRNRRMELSKVIEKNIEETLFDLQLKNTRFHIYFDDDVSFKSNGLDKIDFLISFNEGEPLKPLSKVASGGELSRFMLSLKTLLSEKMQVQTIVFDEIDNGVSGSIANSIANKIHQISNRAQVLCVTHLPQVAATANHHYKIFKIITDDGRTTTKITKLSYDERVHEIALMISKGKITPASISLAKELLSE